MAGGAAVIDRVLEPEVMDTDEEARAYDAMDHLVVNRAFAEEVAQLLSRGGRILDLGTGTARIPIAIVELFRSRSTPCSIVAVDGAKAMLSVARQNIAEAGMEREIELVHADAKALGTL